MLRKSRPIVNSLLIVDHTTKPGGAELALPLFGRTTEFSHTFLFLEPGVEELGFRSDAPLILPSRNLGILGQIVFLWRTVKANPDRAIISNTARASVLVALLPGTRGRHICLLHDGVDSQSMSFLKRWLFRWVVGPRVAAILPNSEWTRGTVPAGLQGKTRDPVYSFSGVQAPLIRAPSSFHHRSLCLVSLSRLVPWKGIHVVIDAIRIIEQIAQGVAVSLTIAGDATMGNEKYKRRLAELSQGLCSPIRFTGHVSDVAALLESSDVLIHASVRPEPFGQVVVQGMGHALVVIATRAGGPAELIDDEENGLLYAPGDAHALAHKILAVANARDYAYSLSSNASKRAAVFTDHAVARRMDDALRSEIVRLNEKVGRAR